MIAKLERLRAAIKAGLVDAGIWEDAAIITGRQVDLWNDIAVAIQAAAHGTILVIGVAAGDATEEGELMNDLTVVVTLIAKNQLTPDQVPEEKLWEDTVKLLHDSIPVYEGGIDDWPYRLRYQGFTDADFLLEDHEDIAQLARQTSFKVRMPL